MKTKLRPVPPPSEEVHVGCAAEDGKVHLFGTGPRRAWRLAFDPGQAVKLWRCLMGEYSTALADDALGDTYQLWNHVDPKLGDLWEFVRVSGERLFSMDADQALALAWAIEQCCGIALYTSTLEREMRRAASTHVWVLASKRMLTGDRAGNGAARLGGTERVFLTKEAALDALREFLRPLVNEAEPNPFVDVDEKIDYILDDRCTDDTPRGDHWSYDGAKQSFEVTLSRIEVEKGMPE